MKECIFLQLILASFILHPSVSLATDKPERRGSQIFIDRQWNIRYYLRLQTVREMELTQEVAAEINARDEKNKSHPVYLQVEHLFKPTSILKTSDKNVPREENFAITIISFDRIGNVTTSHTSSMPLKAKLTRLNDIALTTDDSGTAIPFFLARWFWGIPGDGAMFSPAVCSPDEEDRYVKGHDASKHSSLGNFGCREWTYQLYDPGRHYIDVTSYESNNDTIKPFVGWSRFSDALKPIIGKHDKTWLCLHECPAGEEPGIIPNIAAWTKKHGFPLPQRPEKQPMFPDADYPYDPDE